MKGYTTIIVTALGLITATIGWLTGGISGETFFMAAYGGLMVIFARMGVDIQKGGWLSGYKTHLTAIAGILTTIGGYIAGELSVEKAITAIVMGIVGMRFRSGIKKLFRP